MIPTIINGWPLFFDENARLWLYQDTGQRVDKTPRTCSYCGKDPVRGHDHCIVDLPGVQAACCGHGRYEGYLLFEDGTIITGKFFVKGRK